MPEHSRSAMLAEIERLECEESLLAFVVRMWPVVEPATELKLGETLEAICFHLEAVTRGEITRLLINVPPGSMKSLLTDVFWPAWEWTTRPWLRYVSFSYASNLTEGNNRKFLALISSREYNELWGAAGRGRACFALRKQGETEVSNSATGSKFATSVGGVGTGKRGDRVVCFPYGELVRTEDGAKPIGWLVETRYAGRVWAYDRRRHRFELRSIVRWNTNPGRALVRLGFFGGGSLTCTEDHKVMATTGEWVAAGSLQISDRLLAAPRGMLVSPAVVVFPQRQVEMIPRSPAANVRNRACTHAELCGERGHGALMASGDLPDHVGREMVGAVGEMPVTLAVGDILRAGAVFEVGEPRVGPVVVSVPDLLSGRARAKECCRHELVSEAVGRFATDPHGDARIALVEDRRQDLAAIDTALVVSPRQASNLAEARDGVEALGADNLTPVVACIESVDLIHDVPEATYCLAVEDHHTLLCGTGHNIVCSNCDDPHNVKEAESEAVRTSTVEWFANAMSNRLNDLKRSAIVIIMQRVHEEDVSGFVLSKALGYTHLMIPAEFEDGRDVENDLGWRDWRTEEGESFWPERYPPDVLASIKRTQSPWAYAGQYQQRPDPKGGGILLREWWQHYVGVEYPVCDYLVASIDTAFGEKQENDFSAMTIWGVYTDEKGVPRALMMYAWQARLAIHDLVERTAITCRKFKVDRLLVEAKASGISLQQELRRLYSGENWGVTMVDPGRSDKVARVHAISHLFFEGIVQVPALVDETGGETPRVWAQMVIDQAALFPRGAHDDLVDTVSQALRHLRDLGLLTKAVERQREEFEAMQMRKPLDKLYPA